MNEADEPVVIPVTFDEMLELSIDGIGWPQFKALLIARAFPADQIAQMERDMEETQIPDGHTIH